MTTEANPHAAARLYPHMDASLQKAFYICYRNTGKISTKRLIASFVDSTAVALARRVVQQVNYDVPDAAPETKKCYDVDPGAPPDEIKWLKNLKHGPGVSPCVMRTCNRLLKEEENSSVVDTLAFFEMLAATAVGLSRKVSEARLDVPTMVAQARRNHDPNGM